MNKKNKAPRVRDNGVGFNQAQILLCPFIFVIEPVCTLSYFLVLTFNNAVYNSKLMKTPTKPISKDELPMAIDR